MIFFSKNDKLAILTHLYHCTKNMEAAITIRNLSCERGEKIVFSQINVSIPFGEMLLLTGPNGSGKSSFLRCLAGLLPKRFGEISLACELATQLVYIGHENGLKAKLTLRENLVLLYGLPPENVQSALKAFNLTQEADMLTYKCSAGQKRKAALARLLAQPQKLWVLDEPLTALDEHGTQVFEEALARHLQQQGTAVIASHQPFASFRGHHIDFNALSTSSTCSATFTLHQIF